MGSLQFKTAWKLYSVKRGLGIECVMPQCFGEQDDWDHVRKCVYYDTKWNPKWCTEEEISKYIVKLSRE